MRTLNIHGKQSETTNEFHLYNKDIKYANNLKNESETTHTSNETLTR